MDDALRDAIGTALRRHEIGAGDPYRLAFAGRGRSGASFGAYQGDVAANPLARDTLRRILAAAALAPPRIDAIMARLAQPAARDPLSPDDAGAVAAALAAPAGRAAVDAMDERILAGLCAAVDDLVAAAAARRIEPTALVYIALWINMSGPPTTLRQWLSGAAVWLDGHMAEVAAPGPVVTVDDVADYLKATRYFAANPDNFAQLAEAVAADGTRLA